MSKLGHHIHPRRDAVARGECVLHSVTSLWGFVKNANHPVVLNECWVILDSGFPSQRSVEFPLFQVSVHAR